MRDKVPSYIEFTPHTDGNYTAKDNDGSGGCGSGGECDLTSYMDEDWTKNRDHIARDCGNWRGGGEDKEGGTSEQEDLEEDPGREGKTSGLTYRRYSNRV